jgi:hypothetical protein
MNDWLLTLQYPKGEGQRAPWSGGFMPWLDGKAATLPPDIQSAPAAESLAHACRVARLKEDLPRLRRYRAALENALAFLTTLQYNDTNCSHFAEWYRPLIAGAFHASHQDGNLRLDYTHHALSALVCYWNHAAETTRE